MADSTSDLDVHYEEGDPYGSEEEEEEEGVETLDDREDSLHTDGDEGEGLGDREEEETLDTVEEVDYEFEDEGEVSGYEVVDEDEDREEEDEEEGLLVESGSEAEEDGVVYVVVRQPFAPDKWFEAHVGKLDEMVCTPAKMFSVEAVFTTEHAARLYCEEKNIEHFVDTFWCEADYPKVHQIMLKEARAMAAEDAGVKLKEAPEALMHTHFVGLAQVFLEAHVTKEPLVKTIEKMGGGYSFSSSEVWGGWP